jgi:hypothetical protein
MDSLKVVATSLLLALSVACGSSSSSGGDTTTCGAGTALANGQCVPLQMCGAGTVSQNGTCVPGAGGGAGAGGGITAAAGGTGTGGASAGGAASATGGTGGAGGTGGGGGGSGAQSFLRANIDGASFNWTAPVVSSDPVTGLVAIVGGQMATEQLSLAFWASPTVGKYTCASGGFVISSFAGPASQQAGQLQSGNTWAIAP